MANPNSAAQRSFAAEPYDSVAAVLASKQITAALVGQTIHTKDGYAYQVAAANATDHHVTTAGGVKLYLLPGADGRRNFAGLGIVSSTLLNQTALFAKAAAVGGPWTLDAGYYRSNMVTGTIPIQIDAPNKAIIEHLGGTDLLLNLTSATSDVADRIKGVRLKGIRFVGLVGTAGFSEFKHLLVAQGVEDFEVRECDFIGFQGDGIYFGGSTGRLNENVRVIDCLFDGVNKDNRQGVSVIDGDGVKILRSTFIRCTRPNMPGAIDFEPNNAGQRIRNVKVNHCHFEDTGGDGCICVIMVNHQHTVDPENFDFNYNTFDVETRAFVFRVTGTYTRDHNLQAIGNTGRVSSIGDFYPKLKKAAFMSNILSVSGQANFGLSSGDEIEKFIFIGNSIDGRGTANRAFNLRSGSVASIHGNTFSNFAVYGFLCGIEGGSLSHVSIVTNIFTAIGTYAVGSSGGIDGASCVYRDNISSVSHQFPAWRTDDTGAIANGNTPVTFNSATPPSAFLPHKGVHVARLDQDTGIPNIGGRQGILRTHTEGAQAGRKYIYQTLHHANNNAGVMDTYMRRALNGSDGWEAWSKVQGVAA